MFVGAISAQDLQLYLAIIASRRTVHIHDSVILELTSSYNCGTHLF